MHSSQCNWHWMKNVSNFISLSDTVLQLSGFKLPMLLITWTWIVTVIFARTWIITITFYQKLICHRHFLPGLETSPSLFTRKVTVMRHFLKIPSSGRHFLSMYTPIYISSLMFWGFFLNMMDHFMPLVFQSLSFTTILTLSQSITRFFLTTSSVVAYLRLSVSEGFLFFLVKGIPSPIFSTSFLLTLTLNESILIRKNPHAHAAGVFGLSSQWWKVADHHFKNSEVKN